MGREHCQGCTMSPTIPDIGYSTGAAGTQQICEVLFTCTGTPGQQYCGESSCSYFNGMTEQAEDNPSCCSGSSICTDITCANYNPSDPSCCTGDCNPDCTNYNPSDPACLSDCWSDGGCPGSEYCNCIGSCWPLAGAGGGCPCGDDDCTGGLGCTNGVCTCDYSCQDPSCPGYDVCTCLGTCADSSCPGYDPCICE